ncbi:thioredoxin reductase (NADPH) [Caldanaerobacter subterraneus subsp. tengcongensis MB4]|uniref:Thioredoxin reductase n=3 Tax=Caldanaerobacter subterraneus TaxID=911092 RepID=Q8R8V8_CALS4|nr:thioredoxin-disulfide reductase [Caldanaerobacter subterraneus]MBE3593004.1 thioredoxin-disulfide reductase [Thermoanaerobacter sp.]AAM25065.1 Thioredoxin reductase [Caldanaerobacter subterraneus subsp. tengcongensis MB4]ERM93124.1 thioredoxin reductase [Caldanaerobacter subterraneus subsp. yonseiensis KB-1]KKC29248.1 thioredoxin reductase [Caldanaerobacter subterraneus subsp. pacificus DSM 12653]MCS3915347.1 thioredoxin reductase (NADPH) [Caldanaerobacter subterraneus subsp. tengcongensis 
MSTLYDCLIIGGGPAGLSAAIYASRGKLNTVVFERSKIGGQAAITDDIENYPGSVEEATGPKIVKRMREQAESFGTCFVMEEVKKVELSEKIKKVITTKGCYEGKTVIIATGAEHMKLNVPGEEEFIGKGVSYCATCDADFFTDLDVVVVGGGDSAVQEALYLTKFAKNVTIIHRRDKLRANKCLQDKAFKNPKIKFLWDSVVERIEGDGIVEKVIVRNVKTGELKEVKTDGVFIFIGMKPSTEIFKGLIEMDERGYILTDENMRTNIEGVFAAGDCRAKLLRQIVTAAADGAIAAVAAERYIEELEC